VRDGRETTKCGVANGKVTCELASLRSVRGGFESRLPDHQGLPLGRLLPGSQCFHNASMPNILVRDLPEEIHATLQQRAERRGQSLQQYLASELTRLAERPTPEELFARVSRRRGGRVGLAQAVADLAGERPAS
jgi:plasmid stability protein